jgi:hypothetical protein
MVYSGIRISLLFFLTEKFLKLVCRLKRKPRGPSLACGEVEEFVV